MSRALKRHCIECGRLVRGKTRCAACEPRRAEIYGQGHRRYREALLAALRGNEGALCPRCGKSLGSDPAKLHLGHVRNAVDGGGKGPRRLEHAKCNTSAGGIRGSTYKPKRGES